jgi:hypothetical protein
VQHKVIIMGLFEHRHLLDTFKREIILLATEPGRERRSTPSNLPHQLEYSPTGYALK